jgi:hypothetical protein
VKAQEENKKGARIVMLVPPVLNTKYFANYPPNEIRLIVGRLAFVLDGVQMKSSTQDSCLLIFDNKKTKVRPLVKFVQRNSLTNPDAELL